MSSLYELAGHYLQLEEMLEDPETDQESFLAAMSAISDEIEVKADNYAKLIKNMEASVDSIALEQKRLADRKKALENRIARLKTNLQENMEATGKRKFQTALFSFDIRKNGGAMPVIVDVDTSMLPDEFVIVSEKPDLKALSAYIEKNPNCKFAHFGERGESLRIK